MSHHIETVRERKAELRRRMRLARDLIENQALRSVSLWAQVGELPAYRSARTVMAFVGVRGEPDTDPLFARLAADGKVLVLPSMEDHRIVPRLLGSGLEPGWYGVPAPQGEEVDPATIDLVLVPGLAFTPQGGRLGQGGGHYDRFLPTLRHDCVTVGVCFAEQLVDHLPGEDHDHVVHVVVVDAPNDDTVGVRIRR